MEALKLELERLEERIAPWFVGGVVLQGAVGASAGAGVSAGGTATNGTGTNGTGTHGSHGT